MNSRPFFLTIWFLLVCLVSSKAWGREFSDVKNTIFYLGAGIITAYYFWKERNSLEFKINHLLVSLILYLVIASLSIVFAQSAQYEGALSVTRLILWFGLVWSITKIDLTTIKTLGKFLLASALIFCLIVVFRVLLSYQGHFIIFAGHVSYLSDFIALNIPIALLFFVCSRGKWKIFWMVLVMVLIVGLVKSGTRASFLGAILGLVLASILLIKEKLIEVKYILICAIIFIIFSFVLTGVYGRDIRGGNSHLKDLFNPKLFTSFYGLSSERVEIWKTALHQIKGHPFIGWGLGGYRFVYPESQHNKNGAEEWLYHPHNEILHQAVETGILGSLLFLITFSIIFMGSIKQLKLLADRDDKILIILSLSAITIGFVSWQFSTNFLYPVSRLIVAYYFGILLKYISFRERKTFIINKKLVLGLISFFLILTIFITSYHISLVFRRISVETSNIHDQRRYSAISYYLAPLAFDPLFNFSKLNFKIGNIDKAAQLTNLCYKHYPYVPAVLYLKAQSDFLDGNFEDAKKHAEHAIRNSKYFDQAVKLLEKMNAIEAFTSKN